jgi:hypothetical protein
MYGRGCVSWRSRLPGAGGGADGLGGAENDTKRCEERAPGKALERWEPRLYGGLGCRDAEQCCRAVSYIFGEEQPCVYARSYECAPSGDGSGSRA